MSIPAEKLEAAPSRGLASQILGATWTDQAARTTAVLAVLAALASAQYAGQFSRTILAQSEATNEWNHFSAKSIKKHLTINQFETLEALALSNPHLREHLNPLVKQTDAEAGRYERETKEIRHAAEGIDRNKRREQRKGDRFQYAFVALQAGVVLSTVSTSSRKKFLWISSMVLGVIGLLFVLDGFLLFL